MKVIPTQPNLATVINQTSATEQTRTQAAEGLSIERSQAIAPQLGEAQTQISALPEVDLVKVAEIKEAISSGKLSINQHELISAMQKYYQR